MQLIIAAVLSVVTALIEYTIVGYLKIGEATPHPVLVLGVIWAVVGGIESGLTWAFVGGIALDIVTQRPLGSSAFSLLMAVGAAWVVAGLFVRIRIAAPIAATVPASVIYTMLLLATTTALSPAGFGGPSLDGVLPSAAYDAVLAAILGPLIVAIAAQRPAERVE